jgi:hypothetical protein
LDTQSQTHDTHENNLRSIGMDLEGGQSAAASTSAAGGADKAEDAKEEGEKISTSGPRMSRREAYRSSKGFTVKQTPKTHFTARGESESSLSFFLSRAAAREKRQIR